MSQILADFSNKQFATSGHQAIRMAFDQPPDLVLLDADMPGMSGFEVLKHLRDHDVTATVPVIFATSLGVSEVEIAALDGGAADFVHKPLVSEQVLARVRAQLRARADRQALSAPPRQTPRVLVVDDEVAAIASLRYALAGLGDLHFARSGEDALAQARQLVPDLIMLDLHMPEMDGFAVCRALKEDLTLKYVPVVFVTRYNEADNETRALEMGAADFIAKPYSAAVLKARVRNLLELKRRTDAELRAAVATGRRLADSRLAEILESASDAIITLDASWRILLMNAAAGRLFGVVPNQQIGLPLGSVGAQGLDATTVPLRKTTRLSFARRDGGRIAAEASAFDVGSGHERLFTLVLRDVGDRERLEAETRARLQAEAVLQAKNSMIAYVAHELGNPLNGLLGLLEVAARDPAHPLPAVQVERLELMRRCGDQLRSLLRDVLDMRRLESGKLTVACRPTDPCEVASEAIAAVAALAKDRGVLLLSSGGTAAKQAHADPGRLRQCLVNLISNAVKYSPRGGEVRVHITAENEDLCLTVEDNGSGMTPAQLRDLFEPFNRLGRDDSTPGVGLGLSITRMLVEAMSGRLAVSSEPGVGSRFTIVLPLEGGPRP
ncbi:response regulator [Aquabacterium sp. J223]|nr:response regulator [Aquabacterium sp. J223]